MAGITVIDQLIVKLGLDPRDFTKGEKEVAASVLKTEQSVKKSAGGINKELAGMAAKWLTVAAAIALVKKAVNVIDDVAQRTRKLGIDAKNYDIAANRLRNFENAVEMMGGNAEEARKTIAGFQKSIFDLAYNGQMSDSLVMLARLGVQFQDASGQARDFGSVVLDTADAIGEAQKQGMSRASANQFLQQAGFDSGTAQLILSGRANAEAELKAQEQRRQVNAEDIAKATDIRRASIGKDQSLETVAIRGMDAAGGIQKGVNEFIDKLASGDASAALGQLATGASHVGTVLEDWALKMGGTTRGLRNNNPGNLKAVGGQRRDREGFAVFDTMDEGVRKNNEQLQRYAKRGINTIDAIVNTWAPAKDKNNVAAYIADVVKDTGIAAKDKLDEADIPSVMAAMFKHESGAKAPGLEDIVDVLTYQNDAQPSPLAAAGGAAPTPGVQGSGGGNVTTIDIDSITVQTQAKDADRMAADMDGAVKRKLFASHAEQGMQ